MLNPKNSNILLVDDLAENLLALEALIRRDGRTIYQASSGSNALELLLKHEFALAILDVQMPGMNGFELAELMRGTKKTRHIPIVFVTAAGKESNYSFKGYEAGAVDFLYKPLDIQAVQGKVDVFVELYQQRSEIARQVNALEKSRHEQELLLARLQVAQGELQKAVSMRDDFVSVVAHELLTPLNTLFLEAQQRKMELDRGNAVMFDEALLKQLVARDTRQIQSMVRLIDDMLDVSRIRGNQLAIRPRQVDLTALLSRAIGTVSTKAAAAGVSITLKAGGAGSGVWDEFRIEQVIVNLLDNALEYGDSKPVEVNVKRLPESVLIEIRDKGPGVATQDHKRIFEQFERGTELAKGSKSSSLGLGLYISRQIVLAHGGTVTVESPPGDGATFSVSLPLRSLPAGAS